MEKKDISKLKLELKEFTGTEQYYYNPLFPEHKYTDGVKFLAERTGAYWLIEFVIGYSEIPALEEEAFQVWKLIVKGDNSALIKVEDGNENVLKQFKIPFTDFPLEQIDLWLINNVLILPSEY